MRVFGIEVQVVAQNALVASATYNRRPPTMPGSTFEMPLPAMSSDATTTHRVAPGENLTKIVQQHLSAGGKRPSNAEVYAGVQSVAKANGLANPNLIYPGQEIELSVLERTSSATTPGISADALPDVALPEARTVLGTPLPRRTLEGIVPLDAPEGDGITSAAGVAPVDALLEESGGAPTGTPVRIAASSVAALMTPPTPAEEIGNAVRRRSGATGGDGPVPSDAAVALQRVLNRTSSALHALRGLVDGPGDAPQVKRGPWDNLLQGKARISSEFGTRRDPFTGRMAFHDGIDLAAKRGTEITAVRGGEVIFAGWKGGYGNTVILRHGDGVETLYAHASKLRVTTGQNVAVGETIADVGSSGRSTGPHVHFEVREHGRAVNPMPYLSDAGPDTAAHRSSS